MTSLTIVPMTPDDLSAVMAIETVSFTVPWTEEDFRAMLAQPQTVMLCAKNAEGTICGYVGYMGVMETGDILNVAVHPDFRRQNIGRLLMQAAHSDAAERGVEDMLLEVRESNLSAIALYQSLGFYEAGRRRRFYRNPSEDALVMLLDVEMSEKNIE